MPQKRVKYYMALIGQVQWQRGTVTRDVRAWIKECEYFGRSTLKRGYVSRYKYVRMWVHIRDG